MKQLTVRLTPGQFLKEEIMNLVRLNGIKAGVILSIVGGLEKAVLRMAGSDADDQKVKEWEQDFEIVAGTGTVSPDGCHIHVALSDTEGNVIGGHLKDGCKVKYTAEVVIGIFEDVVYQRTMDEETGFPELHIESSW